MECDVLWSFTPNIRLLFFKICWNKYLAGWQYRIDFESVENCLMKDIYTIETAGNKEKWEKKNKGEPAVVARVKQSTNECFLALFYFC